MRHALLGAAAVLALAGAAVAQEIVQYRTSDGRIGFAQDLSAVPQGAEVLSMEAPRREIKIVAPAAPTAAAASPARPMSAVAAESGPVESAAEQRRRQVRKAISETQAELERARDERNTSCAKRRGRTFVDEEGCYEARSSQRSAEARLEEIRAQLEEEFEDVEDYFPPAEDDDLDED
jgi:hypothetical protein